MSEHKQAGVAASVNSGMVVHGGMRPGRARVHVKLWGIVFCVAVVLVGAGLLVYGHDRSVSKNNAGKGTVKTPPASTDAEQKAQYYADEGQYKLAEQSWQDQLASAKTTGDKVAIYYQQAAVAIRFKQYGNAKKYADSIKQVAPDAPDSYVVLAQLAQAQGNIPQAKQYWQQAINHINADTPADKMVRSDYINQMDALK